MSDIRTCIVYCGKGNTVYSLNDKRKRIAELIQACVGIGISDNGVAEASRSFDIESIVIGEWFRDGGNKIFFGGHSGQVSQRPDLPVFALGQHEEIMKFLTGDIYDNTPLPTDMKKELAEETQKRFNLSPEQWDCLNPAAREALATARQVVRNVDGRWWYPIGLLNGADAPSDSIIITNNINDCSVANLTPAYPSGDDVIQKDGPVLRRPTHFCILPSRNNISHSLPPELRGDYEPEGEPEETGEDV